MYSIIIQQKKIIFFIKQEFEKSKFSQLDHDIEQISKDELIFKLKTDIQV